MAVSPEIRKLVNFKLNRMEQAYAGVLIAMFLREHPWVSQFTLYLVTSAVSVQANVAHVQAGAGSDIPVACLESTGEVHQRKASQLIADWWDDHRGDMHSALADDQLSDAQITVQRSAVASFLEDDDIDGLAVIEALEAVASRPATS